MAAFDKALAKPPKQEQHSVLPYRRRSEVRNFLHDHVDPGVFDWPLRRLKGLARSPGLPEKWFRHVPLCRRGLPLTEARTSRHLRIRAGDVPEQAVDRSGLSKIHALSDFGPALARKHDSQSGPVHAIDDAQAFWVAVRHEDTNCGTVRPPQPLIGDPESPKRAINLTRASSTGRTGPRIIMRRN